MDRDLEADLRLCEAATPGPWYAHNPDDHYCMNVHCVTTKPVEPDTDVLKPEEFSKEIVAMTLYQVPRVVCHDAGLWEQDAEMIAAAREGWPYAIRLALDRGLALIDIRRIVQRIQADGRCKESDLVEIQQVINGALLNSDFELRNDLDARLAEKDAEISRLRRLLEPFANYVDYFDCPNPESSGPSDNWLLNHCRAARDELRKGK